MAAHTCLHSVLKMQPSEACAHFLLSRCPLHCSSYMIKYHPFQPHVFSRCCQLPAEPLVLCASRPVAISQIALGVEGPQHQKFTRYRSLGDPRTQPLACVFEGVISSMCPLAAEEAIAPSHAPCAVRRPFIKQPM
jgi:hypothetical protein